MATADTPLPGMEHLAGRIPETASVSGRGDGDDAVVLAWEQLFTAYMRLRALGTDPRSIQTVLYGYEAEWPL